MKKAVKLSLIASVVMGSCLSLSAADANIDLQKKISELEAQIKEIKALQIKSNDAIEERVDKIETSTMTDKINFGLDFRTRVDNFNAKDASGAKSSSKNVWSNRLRLNMNSDISDDMKFTGRLSMYKNWSDTGASYAYSSMDPMQGRRPSDSGVSVERAYVDWMVSNSIVPVTLTIGRQPSSDGPSHQFKDNTVRKATYSALSFDGAADGVVATLGLSKLTGVEDMALRFGYGKGYQADTTYTYIGNSGNIKDTNVYGAFFDTSIGIAGSLLQLSAVKATDVVSNTVDMAGTSTNSNIGKIMLYTAMLEFSNFKNSGLDMFAHYAISKSKPNGVTSNQATPYGFNMPMGFLTNTLNDTQSKNGEAFWVGGRYTLPLDKMKNPKIGVEYNKGSKNWFSFTQGSNSLTNKLATRGDALEVYYIQPINRYASLRFGAEMIDYDYTGSGYQVGATMKVSDMGGNTLDKLNNYYLLFNLIY